MSRSYRGGSCWAALVQTWRCRVYYVQVRVVINRFLPLAQPLPLPLPWPALSRPCRRVLLPLPARWLLSLPPCLLPLLIIIAIANIIGAAAAPAGIAVTKQILHHPCHRRLLRILLLLTLLLAAPPLQQQCLQIQ